MSDWPPEGMIEVTCDLCGLRVGEPDLHRAWHESRHAESVLLDAHVENLIERMYVAEQRLHAWTDGRVKRFVFASGEGEWLVTVFGDEVAELAFRDDRAGVWGPPLHVDRTDHDRPSLPDVL